MSIEIKSELVRHKANPFANIPEIKQLLVKYPDPKLLWTFMKAAVSNVFEAKGKPNVDNSSGVILLEAIEYIVLPWIIGGPDKLDQICYGFEQLSNVSDYQETLMSVLVGLAGDFSDTDMSPDGLRESAIGLAFCFDLCIILKTHSTFSDWSK